MIQMQIIGRLGKDCEVKALQSGKTVINFSVAVDTGWGDNKKTLWIECAKFGENTKVAQYLVKGTQVHVAGTPDIRTWGQGADKNFALQLTVNDITLCGGGGAQQQQAAPAQQQPKQTTPSGAPVSDDLPF